MAGVPGPGNRAAPEVRLERVRAGDGSGSKAPVVAAVVVGFMVVAIAMPWGGTPPGVPGSTLPSGPSRAVAEAANWPAVVTNLDLLAPPEQLEPQDVLGVGPVEVNLERHDEWGIRVLVETPGLQRWPRTFVERWMPVSPGSAAAPTSLADGYVRAIGLTAPRGVMILDVRVVVRHDGRDHWLDLARWGAESNRALLFAPPRDERAWPFEWPPGDYEFSVLTAGGFIPLGLRLPGALRAGDRQDDVRRLWAGTAGTAGWGTLLGGLPDGIFVGFVPSGSPPGAGQPVAAPVPIHGGASSVDLVSAWIGATVGPPGQVPFNLAERHLTRAVAIGVAGPPGATIRAARLERLYPATAAMPGEEMPAAIISLLDDAPRREAARFEEPTGRAWPPGVYRMELVLDGDGAPPRTVAWGLSILPGPARPLEPIWLAREYAPFAGRWGIAYVRRHTTRLPGRPDLAASEPEAAIAGGLDLAARCESLAVHDRWIGVIGVVHPAAAKPRILLQRVHGDTSEDLSSPLVAPSVLPGLSLIAPGLGPTQDQGWEPGWYRALVTTDAGTRALPFCVGSFDGVQQIVPVDGGRRLSATPGS